MTVSTGEVTRLTMPPGVQSDPCWSPDGALVAFSSTRDGTSHIYVTNADGRGARQVTTGAGSDASPQWSPDARLIAFVSEREHVRDVYATGVDGGRPQRLTNGLARHGTHRSGRRMDR